MRREERSGAEIPEDNYIASDDDVGDFKLFVGLDEWRQLVVRAGRQADRPVDVFAGSLELWIRENIA